MKMTMNFNFSSLEFLFYLNSIFNTYIYSQKFLIKIYNIIQMVKKIM